MRSRVYCGFTAALFIFLAVALTGCGDGLITQLTFYISRASVDSLGVQANSGSSDPSISTDGRYVAFRSFASNLVAGDANGQSDIFVHDRIGGGTTLVSVDTFGTQANNGSGTPSISSDGRYVAFQSGASNLVAADANGFDDIFVRDRQLATTALVSVDSSSVQANSGSYGPSISADGRYVAFWSFATNLVTGDTNGQFDVFVRDRQTATTTRASVDVFGAEGNNGSYAPSISSDGRYVAFQSAASNLVAGDTNGFDDIFVRDRQLSNTTRVSVSTASAQANSSSYAPSISADGRYVAFWSFASNLVAGDTNGQFDVFVRDTQLGTTTRVSVGAAGVEGNNASYDPSISPDGRYVAFRSAASNLVNSDTNGFDDIFVRDTVLNTTTRANINSIAEQANNDSYAPSISTTGPYVAFQSAASNLVNGDTLGFDDIFIVLKK